MTTEEAHKNAVAEFVRELDFSAECAAAHSREMDSAIVIFEKLFDQLDKVKGELKSLRGDTQRAMSSASDAYRTGLAAPSPDDLRNLLQRVQRLEVAGIVGGDVSNMAAAWRGELTAESAFKRGEIWRYRGTLYAALKSGTARKPEDMPPSYNGPDATWLPFTGPGSHWSIAPQTFSTLTSAPATATSPGLAGQIAYSGGYYFLCVAPNTWRRSALTSF